MKNRRHAKILDIITRAETLTQSDLTEQLGQAGFDVTQATVSRDIKELGLVRIPSGSKGYKYALPEKGAGASSKHLNIFSQSVISIRSALHTVVIKTLSGMAQAAAAAIDSIAGDEYIGSIAGDDTILIVAESETSAKALVKKLTEMQSGTLL